jgi:prepilin signal peptidase PulO-like enzyme (type II secretory pathway)
VWLALAEWLLVHPWVPAAPLLGGAFASFLCVVAERVPKGRSINGRSLCVCGEQLRVWRGARPENVPVLGWVASWGRTHCGAKLPASYVVCEIALAAGFTVAAATLPTMLVPLAWAALTAGCLAAAWKALATKA